MKSNIILAMTAACLVAFGCAKVEVDTLPQDQTYKVILSGDIDTRTSFAPEDNGMRPVLWKAGDLLGLFVNEGEEALSGAQNVIARLYDGSDNGPGYSKGSFTTDLPLSAQKTYSLGIYYPYIATAGTPSEIAHKIPAIQTQSAVTDSRHLGMSGSFAYGTAKFATPSDLQYYESPVVTFTLEHKTSAMQLSLTAKTADIAGWKVKAVKVKAPQGCPIAGDVKYIPATDEFALTGNTSESIALNVPSGAVLSTETPVELFMVAFPTALAGKSLEITYTLESADASKVTTLTHTRTVKDASNALKTATVHVFEEALPAADEEGWVYSTSDTFDLSANGTANCYIVSAPGKYSFDATVIGNGQKGIMTPISTTFFHTEDATIAPVSASLVWQQTKGLITSVALDNGRVVFTKSADVEYGNALIAVKDAEGTILWSWHIWCTDMGESQTWVSPTGTYEAMDRNLGATYASTEKITDETLAARAVGLFYQWGRKDPFLGPQTFDAARSSNVLATAYDIDGNEVTRISRKAASQLIGQSIEYCIKNPFAMPQVGGNTNSDWYANSVNPKGTGPTAAGYYFWGNPEGYNYAKVAKPSPVKTIYDPCPAGYMVPTADFFTAARIKTNVAKLGNLVTVDGGTTTTWLPLNSAITSGSSNTWVKDGQGYYWTSTFQNSNSRRTYNINMGASSVGCFNGLNNGYAFGVRCIQEIH